jgi:hypothetical protein
MPQEEIATVVGLVGLSLVIAVGGWLDEVREWLLGFSVRFNPLRILGLVLSSTMAVGFIVGTVYALRSGRDPIVVGGSVALISAVADEALAMMHGIVRRLMPSRPPPPPEPLLPPPKKDPSKRTEEEAHAELDAREAEEVR